MYCYIFCQSKHLALFSLHIFKDFYRSLAQLNQKALIIVSKYKQGISFKNKSKTCQIWSLHDAFYVQASFNAESENLKNSLPAKKAHLK